MALADDEHYESQIVQDAIIDFCCMLREERGVEVATLQLHIIGVYRRIRALMLKHQTLVPDLTDLRSLPCARLGRVLQPIPIHFGVPGMDDGIVVTGTQASRMVDTIRDITSGRAEATASGANRAPNHRCRANRRSRSAALPIEQREDARQALVADRIRSRFFRAVFLHLLRS